MHDDYRDYIEYLQPGVLLCRDMKYMDKRSADTARRWIDAWRHMSREEFEESVRRL